MGSLLRLVAALVATYAIVPSVVKATATNGSSSAENLVTTLPQIVGGGQAERGELPYVVSLQEHKFGSKRHVCGGSILQQHYVITAAHCVATMDVSDLRVVGGEHNLSVDEGSEAILFVNKIIIHPNYNAMTFENDIALLRTSTGIPYNDFMQPVNMPGGLEASGNCLVSGWGATEENGSPVDVLRKVVLPIISDEQCRSYYQDYLISDHMLCAGYDEGGKDACHSDDGGPLICTVGGISFLAGISSWGYGCARPARPSVFTEVTHFYDWLNQNTL